MFQTGPVLGESIKGQASRTPGGGGGHSWDNQGHQGRHQGPWGGVQRMRGWCPCGPRAALLRPRPALRPRQCLALAEGGEGTLPGCTQIQGLPWSGQCVTGLPEIPPPFFIIIITDFQEVQRISFPGPSEGHSKEAGGWARSPVGALLLGCVERA